MAKLLLKFEDTILKEVLIEKSSITIGRDSSNDIVIDNLAISRYHSKVFQYHGRYFVEDLNSGNGTFVNNTRIAKDKILRSNDEILVGKHMLVFMNEEKRPAEKGGYRDASLADETVILSSKTLLAHTTLQASTPDNKPSERDGSIVLLAHGSGQEPLVLTKRTTVGGKSDTADIRLKGMFVGHPAFIISKKPEGFFITHCKGLRVTRVNGAAVEEQRELQNGDLITVGANKIQFYSNR